MRPLVLLVLCSLTAIRGFSQSLVLPDQNAAQGQILVSSLFFASEGQTVAAIQFDIASDPGVSFGMLSGAQIGVALKVFYTATLPDHSLRVLIAGINQASIADGELARLVIAVDPGAAPGTAQIRVSNAVAAGPDGSPVAISGVTAAVDIQAGATAQSFVAGSVVNAASLLFGPVSPGEVVTIIGGPGLAAASSVEFNGAPAPLLYAGPGQVNAIVPFGLDTSADANLQVFSAQQSLGTVLLAAAPVSPAVFTLGSNGTGPGAILNQDYTVNSYANPAPPGSVIMLFGTGFGALNPPANDGQTAAGQAPTVMPVTATIAGIPAEVTYAGAAPGLVAGVVQINILVPAGAPANPAAPVALGIGSVASAAGVTVAIQ